MRGLTRPGSADRREGGQVIVLFVLSLMALVAMSALLFDAGQALVLRRQLQDAGDAAAIAASNVIQTGTTKGCSATKGPPPGSPRTEIVTAARNAVKAQLPGTPDSAIHVSCPDSWSNYAVEVTVDSTAPVYFGGAVGFNGFGVHTTSQAVNGQVGGLKWSVVELDPSNGSWPNGRRGCPSMLISGGPQITFDGGVMIDSACTPTNGGALGTNGNSATITMNNSATINMVGGYAAGPLTLSPAPVVGAPYVADPLKSAVANVSTSGEPVLFASRQVYGSGDVTLDPGVYTGGIQLKNSVKAFLHPGVYVMQGGGFDIGAQNAVYSVASTVTTTTDATWATDCTATNCGVVIINKGDASGTGAMGQFTVGAGATLKLRPYYPSADMRAATVGSILALQNLLLWQDASPAPTTSYAQPTVALSGGGSVNISGTVYAPSAAVTMGGGSGGSGGSSTDITLQFISWDITFSGNSSFHFYYQSDAFARPADYGLIK
jgi:Putative Flp pilus-assembly TadE/G-like